MQFPSQCKIRTDRYGSTNNLVSCSAVLGKEQKFTKFRGYLSTWYRVCTNAMFILKGSYGCGEPRNEIYQSVQKPGGPVQVNKLPHVMQLLIAPAMKIFGILGLLFAMVTCLHQCKVYIKKKLRVWRAQKFYLQVSAKTAPTCTGQQTTSCLAAPYWETNRNFQNFVGTYRHRTVFSPMQCLY